MGKTSAPLRFFREQFPAYARKSRKSHRDSARTDANTNVSSMTGARV